MLTIENMTEGELYLDHRGCGERIKAGSDRVFFAMRDSDPQAITFEDRVVWVSVIPVEADEFGPRYLHLACCYTHPKRRTEGLFTMMFDHITALYPGLVIRGYFLNPRLEKFVDRYNKSLDRIAA